MTHFTLTRNNQSRYEEYRYLVCDGERLVSCEVPE